MAKQEVDIVPEQTFTITQLIYPELPDPLEGEGLISLVTIEDRESLELTFTISKDRFKLLEELERYRERLTEKILLKIKNMTIDAVKLRLIASEIFIEKLGNNKISIASITPKQLENASNWILQDILFDSE